jgi:nicotinate-nucleotide adenylyltransferase
MKRIGILGGSFDPPHQSHKAIAQDCIDRNLVDEVWICPTYIHTQKKAHTNFKHRMNMCRIMFESWFSKIKVKDYQGWTSDGSTFSLMEYLKGKNFIYKDYKKDNEFYLIIGRDCADNISSWYNWEELISENSFIVFNRDNHLSDDNDVWYIKKPHRLIYSKHVGDWSSSFIRNKLFKKRFYKLAKLLTSGKLISYINNHNLYEY